MRNLKKFLALVLAFMMAMSLMVTVNASNVEKAPDAENVTAFEEAIDVLMGMGIIRGGDNGAINPKDPITRAEMAAFIYRLYTGNVSGDQEYLYAETATGFGDVYMDQWYAGVIGFCASNRFITGSDGMFRPTDNITGYEALVMVLRAMGYDKEEGEMTGNPEWQQIAHTRANTVGLLTGVNSANYSYSLVQPATREFVAELIFRAAQLPMVTYNRGFINKYEFMNAATGVENQTLGGWRFGLTSNTGIIVGNEATGEGDVTKIGFQVSVNGRDNDYDGIWDILINDSAVITNATNYTANRSAYFYEKTANGLTADALVKNGANVTLSFHDNTATQAITDLHTAQTGLDKFNHKVKVWYDNRSSSNSASTITAASNTGTISFPNNLTTYTIRDLANPNKVVVDDSVARNQADLDSYTAGGTVENLAEILANEGYNVPAAGTNAFYNYAFAPMTASGNYGKDLTEATNSKASPILQNDSATTNGLYLIISNSGTSKNPGVDVVISLEMTLTEIQEDNNYQNPRSFGVLNSNMSENSYTNGAAVNSQSHFGNYTVNGVDHNASPTNDEDVVDFDTYKSYLNIARAHMLGGTEAKDLTKYDKVAVIAITGTNGRTDGVTQYAIDDYTKGHASTITYRSATDKYDLEDNLFYYQINKLENKVSGVVKYIYPDNSVTIALNADDSSDKWVTLPQSVFAESTDGTFAGTRERGVHDMQVNERYHFYVDPDKEWLFYERDDQAGTTFAYGTYFDWETAFISGEFNYGMSYADVNGLPATRDQIKSVDGDEIGSDDYPYADIPMPRREDRSNEYVTSATVPGIYTGYQLSSDGKLTTVTDTDDHLTGFYQANVHNFGADIGDGDGVIKITSNDVTVGVKEFGDDDQTSPRSKLAFTNDTTFYLVSGIGASKTTVAIKSLKDLAGYEIHVGPTGTAYVNSSAIGYLLNDKSFDLFDMVYYSIDTSNNYAQIVRGGAQPIDKVYIPLACVSAPAGTVDGAKLIFVGDSSDVEKKNSTDNGATAATMFNVYDATTGAKEQVWIQGFYDSASATDSKWIYSTGANDNMFVKLLPTSKTAHDGGTIYALTDLSSTDRTRVVGQYWVVGDGVNAIALSDNRYGAYGSTNEGIFIPSYAPGEAYGYIGDESWTVGGGTAGTHLIRIDRSTIVNLNPARYPVMSNAHDLLYTASVQVNGGLRSVSYYMSGTDILGVAFINFPG